MNKHGSKWITPARRLALYIRDRFTCAYCERDLRSAPRSQVTLDHLTARAAGGGNESSNLIVACLHCNSQRSDKPWTEYATTEAIARIIVLIASPLNMELSKSLIADTAGNCYAEAQR